MTKTRPHLSLCCGSSRRAARWLHHLLIGKPTSEGVSLSVYVGRAQALRSSVKTGHNLKEWAGACSSSARACTRSTPPTWLARAAADRRSPRGAGHRLGQQDAPPPELVPEYKRDLDRTRRRLRRAGRARRLRGVDLELLGSRRAASHGSLKGEGWQKVRYARLATDAATEQTPVEERDERPRTQARCGCDYCSPRSSRRRDAGADPLPRRRASRVGRFAATRGFFTPSGNILCAAFVARDTATMRCNIRRTAGRDLPEPRVARSRVTGSAGASSRSVVAARPHGSVPRTRSSRDRRPPARCLRDELAARPLPVPVEPAGARMHKRHR